MKKKIGDTVLRIKYIASRNVHLLEVSMNNGKNYQTIDSFGSKEEATEYFDKMAKHFEEEAE